uniref:Radical SAM superfamily protein n=1 Tax=viral metagenome TaxID=1070528 RepID=A0A6M3JRY7_9ZZZZ
MIRVARVFPRKTKASPNDNLSFFGPPGLFPPSVDEVHISITFDWDLSQAEYLTDEWSRVAPVKIGGPATGMAGGDFVPGMYLRHGYTLTSRGCPNQCWFCSVWKREGRGVRLLPIRDGWNVLDDNLLACPEDHIRSVFAMLKRQKHQAEFTGGVRSGKTQGLAYSIFNRVEAKTDVLRL